jgi:hypothetical protein
MPIVVSDLFNPVCVYQDLLDEVCETIQGSLFMHYFVSTLHHLHMSLTPILAGL